MARRILPPAGVITIPFSPPARATAGFRVAIFDGNDSQNPVGFATQVAGSSPGLYQYTFTTPLADGLHHITAEVQMVDPASPDQTGFGDRSVSLDITVDTVVPPAFFGLTSQADTTQGLDGASDSGVLGNPNLLATFTDRITNDKTPTLYGAAEANAIVRVYLDTNGVAGLQTTGANPDTYLGETVAVPTDGTNQFPNGEWKFTVTRDLNDPLLGLGHDGLRTFFVNGRRPGGQRDPGRQRRLAANLPRHAGTADHQRADHRLAGIQSVRAETQQRPARPHSTGQFADDRAFRTCRIA